MCNDVLCNSCNKECLEKKKNKERQYVAKQVKNIILFLKGSPSNNANS